MDRRKDKCRIYRVAATVVLLGVIVLPWPVALSQTPLEKFSGRMTDKWKHTRAHADSIARLRHLPFKVKFGDTAAVELQDFEGRVPRYFRTDNLNAAISLSTDRVWPGGGAGLSLTGSTDTLGEWDEGGVRTTHQEFQGRVVTTEGALSYHSTHVAGTLIAGGVVQAAKGMSFEGYLRSYDWNNDIAEMSTQASAGMKVSNHSYGLITGWFYDFFGDGRWVWFGDTTVSGTEDYRFGFYDEQARMWDSVSFLAPQYLIVKSAGNDRGEGPSGIVEHWIFNDTGAVLTTAARENDGGATGFDCLNGSAVSKNVLTVGAVYDVQGGYKNPDSVYMTSFSAWGPADDGRIKPDIVADGYLLYSAYGAGDNLYAYGTGTSMSSPNAAGSLGLLLQHQKNLHGKVPLLSSTLKGLVIHTADECGPATGPDYMFGWGLMNTLHAAQVMSQDSADGAGSHIIEGILPQNDTARFVVKADGTRPIRATLCWTDPPGTPPAPALNPPAPMLVNDLDLRITSNATSGVFLPWVLNGNAPSLPATRGDNTVDNVEQVLADSVSRGYYTLCVTHKGSLLGGQQQFSLIVTGNVPTIGPISGIHPEAEDVQVLAGDSASASLSLYNSGDLPLGFHVSAPALPWLLADIDSGEVAPADSEVIHLRVSAAILRWDSTYATSLTLSTNDPSRPIISVPLTVTVLGPEIAVRPPFVALQVDSGGSVTDTIWIVNRGHLTLEYQLSAVDSLPGWLAIGGQSGSVAPNESSAVAFTGQAGSLPPDDYKARFQIHSNDSAKPLVSLNVALRIGVERSASIGLARGWNLISLPVTSPDRSKSSLFPSAISDAFEYNGLYIVRDSLRYGRGYWLRFDQAQPGSLAGGRRVADTIDVRAGWNLIGTVSTAVPINSVGSIPSGIILSKFFTYTSGYMASDSLMPGYGYWVKVSQDGSVIVSADLALAGGRQERVTGSDESPPPPPDSPIPVAGLLPKFDAVDGAYPNPFNPSTTIRYRLGEKSSISLKVYSVLGQIVQVLAEGVEEAGYKSVVWNPTGLASGIYFYRLEARGILGSRRMFSATGKVVLTK